MEEIMKVLNYQPADVLDRYIDHPVSGMNQFFVDHPLHKSRAKLWELFQGWMHLASEPPDGEEMKDMLFFYNRLIEMMNLCYVLTQKNKKV
ncbi:hypothetical protein [Pedobacter psychroterrae]|uniref:Uncharacterized protein n=1 Tax=Pedobacter psychroterrae TaxID=2530453 RepID=A0A4R0NCL4_9SPHI|nr:hypothetical protein [Pedobacter psychroterrae]TCC96792.1 hypothetical protein EZ437_20590 [Pedobacter psychroterrae]